MPSRAIRAFDYDADRHELTIAFASGRTYVYSLVPATVAEAFAAAPSKGAFHNAYIRDRYPYRKVATPRSAASLREQLAASADERGGESPQTTSGQR